MPGPMALVKGYAGKPSHPPLTDVSIGAYTAGVAMLVLGAIGFQEEPMAHGALLTISAGLLVALPTALTGLLDWLDIPRRTPARKLGWVHLGAMLTATVLFAATWLLHLQGYRAGEVTTPALVAGLIAEAVLAGGGYLGGTLAYVYGVRVLKNPTTRVADALVPGRADHASPPHPDDAADTAP
ncbi:MAG: DUF2231 domain-containing protein [Euzebyales bacterium]|nr:DUF2231 domain-containing protein [Euzebyales bacterium]MBA3621744.1 DUF2231 domain-containing protein [Euzebyales bacterium]